MAPVFDQFLRASGEQLLGEMDFTAEAKKLEAAGDFFRSLNSDPAFTKNGWTFEVPALDGRFKPRVDLIAMQKSPGVSFQKIADPILKAEAGELIVRSSLRGLFGPGIFDPDRHRGNTLIDVDAGNKKLHPIDFGQLEFLGRSGGAFSADERLQLALFLWASDRGDAGSALDNALKMSDLKVSSAQYGEMLKSLRQKYLAESSIEKRIQSVVAVFGEQKLPMKTKVLAGTLKGLMTLQAENYVTKEIFREMIHSEIKPLLAAKVPAVLGSFVSRAVNECAVFFGKFGKPPPGALKKMQ